MVLRYQVSDADLTESEVVQRKISVSVPKKDEKVKKSIQFSLLLVANIIVLTLVYNIWAAEEDDPSIWESLRTNKGMVTGIIYDAEEPSAIIHGEVVHEGDSIGGCKVVKIHEEKVELEKNGKRFTKRVK